jgi:hypothetical protein
VAGRRKKEHYNPQEHWRTPVFSHAVHTTPAYKEAREREALKERGQAEPLSLKEPDPDYHPFGSETLDRSHEM